MYMYPPPPHKPNYYGPLKSYQPPSYMEFERRYTREHSRIQTANEVIVNAWFLRDKERTLLEILRFKTLENASSLS